VGDNIKFRFTDPPDPRLKPMSDVFNTPELLEKILLNLRPGFLLQNVQKVCRGFKESIDVSPTFARGLLSQFMSAMTTAIVFSTRTTPSPSI
jgi:hypothetical protein